MQTVLQDIKSSDIVATIVWLPCIDTDSKEAADERVKEFSDERVHYFWDENRLTGNAWQRTLNLPSFAWDVYFLFGPKVKLENQAPVPDFWMHQLKAAEGKAPLLDRAGFESALQELLKKKD